MQCLRCSKGDVARSIQSAWDGKLAMPRHAKTGSIFCDSDDEYSRHDNIVYASETFACPKSWRE